MTASRFVVRCNTTFEFFLTERGSWSSSREMAAEFGSMADARRAIAKAYKRSGDRITIIAA